MPKASPQIILREYQKQLIADALLSLEKKLDTLLYAPTGAGKTEIAIALIQAILKLNPTARVLFVVYAKTLVHQTKKRFADSGLKLGLVQAANTSKDWARSQILVASISTLSQSIYQEKIGDYDLVIIDEAHNAIANGYQFLKQKFTGKILGLTATPFRSDTWSQNHPDIKLRGQQKHLGCFFDNLVSSVQPKDLLDLGMLANVEVKLYTLADRGKLKKDSRTNDFKQSEIFRLMNTQHMISHLHQQYLEHGKDKSGNLLPAIAYCVNAKHCASVTEYFTANDVKAVSILADTSLEDREKYYHQLEAGALTCLVTVGTAIEGLNLPVATVCLIARPTRSANLHIQMLGRFLRTHPQKEKAIIIDTADNTRQIEHYMLGKGFHPYDALSLHLWNTPPDKDLTKALEKSTSTLGGEKEIEDGRDVVILSDCPYTCFTKEYEIFLKLINPYKRPRLKLTEIEIENALLKYLTSVLLPSQSTCKEIMSVLLPYTITRADNSYDWGLDLWRLGKIYHQRINGASLSYSPTKFSINLIERLSHASNRIQIPKLKAEVDFFPEDFNYIPQLEKAKQKGLGELTNLYTLLASNLHPSANRDIDARFIRSLNSQYEQVLTRIP
jgi:superfamily II DNA or RNA helicase